MSDIETRTRQILAPLILGKIKSTTFTPLEQATVNAWVTKTAIIYDQLRWLQRRQLPFFTPQQRRDFANPLLPLEPPQTLLIELASFRGDPSRSGHLTALYGRTRGKHFGNQKSFCLTFTVGAFAFQVFSTRRIAGKRVPLAVAQPRPVIDWPRVAVQSWPDVGDVRWPPREHLTDRGLESFIYRWSKGGPDDSTDLPGS